LIIEDRELQSLDLIKYGLTSSFSGFNCTEREVFAGDTRVGQCCNMIATRGFELVVVHLIK
jgi:hypothetical protein